jgi:hypothetical protein
VSLSPRAIATLGVGFGATAVAYLGLWPIGAPVDPPVPPVPPAFSGGFALPSTLGPKVLISRDDRDLLELVPILVEVINGRR